ncbi:MAG: hypothetical protein IJR47_02390 [Clostridia bacterium]|nr:hypothetical protein [Clostridia bacterium]
MSSAIKNYNDDDFCNTYKAMFRMLESIAKYENKSTDFVKLNNEDFFNSLCALKNASDDLGLKFMLTFDPKDDHIQNISYFSIIHALARDYFLIYYVDLKTNNFVECLGNDLYECFDKGGVDFFEASSNGISKFVHPDDRAMMLNAMAKNSIINAVEECKTFSLIYRLMVNGEPVYVNLNATYLEDGDKDHLVVGMRNVDENIKRREEFSGVNIQARVYSSIIHTLAKDYFNIFYVNIKTGKYIEYNSQNSYSGSFEAKQGENFFADGDKNLEEFIFEQDRARVKAAFEQNTLIKKIAECREFSMTYRWLFNDGPKYVNTKVFMLSDSDHIGVCIKNVDSIIKAMQ